MYVVVFFYLLHGRKKHMVVAGATQCHICELTSESVGQVLAETVFDIFVMHKSVVSFASMSNGTATYN
jgi:hypothetical protein